MAGIIKHTSKPYGSWRLELRSMLFLWSVSLGESCGVAAVWVMRGAGMLERVLLPAATAAASSRSLITATVDGRPSISFSALHPITNSHLSHSCKTFLFLIFELKHVLCFYSWMFLFKNILCMQNPYHDKYQFTKNCFDVIKNISELFPCDHILL